MRAAASGGLPARPAAPPRLNRCRRVVASETASSSSRARRERWRGSAARGASPTSDAIDVDDGATPTSSATPPRRRPIQLLVVDGTNVACGAAAISKRWRGRRRRRGDGAPVEEEDSEGEASPSTASVAGATASSLRWLSASAGWPRVRVALFDPKSIGSSPPTKGRRAEDPSYLARRDKRKAARRRGEDEETPSSSSSLGPPPALAAAAESAGFLPLAARPGFEADDALAQLLRAVAAEQKENGDDDAVAAVASGDRGWWSSASSSDSSLVLPLPARWAAEPGPPPEPTEPALLLGGGAVAPPSSPSSEQPAPCPFLVAALTDGGSSGLRGAGLKRGVAASLASRHGNSLDGIARAAASANATAACPSSSSEENEGKKQLVLPARDWRVALRPGSDKLESARRALRMLKPRDGGGSGRREGALSSSAVARVVGLVVAAAAPAASAPATPPPRSVGRAAAWRCPAARARLSAGKERFRAAAAAVAAFAEAPPPTSSSSSPPSSSVVRATPLASFEGVPVDLELVFEEGSGDKARESVALFVGLPRDFDSRRPPRPPSPSSPSSPTLTSVAKRLRRSGFAAAIVPHWEFDEASRGGKLGEALVSAARRALERRQER